MHHGISWLPSNWIVYIVFPPPREIESSPFRVRHLRFASHAYRLFRRLFLRETHPRIIPFKLSFMDTLSNRISLVLALRILLTRRITSPWSHLIDIIPLKKGNLSIGRKIQDRQTKECRDFDLTGKNTPCVSNNKGVR